MNVTHNEIREDARDMSPGALSNWILGNQDALANCDMTWSQRQRLHSETVLLQHEYDMVRKEWGIPDGCNRMEP